MQDLDDADEEVGDAEEKVVDESRREEEDQEREEERPKEELIERVVTRIDPSAQHVALPPSANPPNAALVVTSFLSSTAAERCCSSPFSPLS